MLIWPIPDDDAVDEELKKKRRLENDRDESFARHTYWGSSRCRLTSVFPNAGLMSGFSADDEYNAYFRLMFAEKA